MTEKTCETRIDGRLNSRLDDLSRLWTAYCDGVESLDDLGSIHEYGLSFDYVAPDTFPDQAEGYFRYQLSWGGPSDEFRFYVNPDYSCHRIEYWFLDWFDGAHRVLADADRALLSELWDWFRESGAANAVHEEAQECA